jgi:alpha-N-arabinofuranosidase
MPNLKEKNIKFIFDEWGCRNRLMSGAAQTPGMLTPLAYALFLNEVFRHSDVVQASCATGGMGTVLIDNTGEATGLSAEGLVLKIMANHFTNALPVAVSGNSPQQAAPGTVFVDTPNVPIGSQTFPLDVTAALSNDRKKLIFSVVNATETAQEFSLKVTGIKLRGPGTLRQIAPPSVNSVNVAGQKPAVEIVEHPQDALPDTVQLPPVSISVYEFEIESA